MKTNSTTHKTLHISARREQTPFGLGATILLSRKIKFERENILRWEDDGGQINGLNSPVDRPHPSTAPRSKKSEAQAYREEYLANDSLGG